VARLTVTVDPLSELVADRVSGGEPAAEAGPDGDADGSETAATRDEPGESATGIDAADSQGHSIEERWGVDDELGESTGTEPDDEPTDS